MCTKYKDCGTTLVQDLVHVVPGTPVFLFCVTVFFKHKLDSANNLTDNLFKDFDQVHLLT